MEQLYIDGILESSSSYTGPFATASNGNLYFSYVPHDPSERFSGLLDNIHIWDMSINQQEIQNYMNCPPTGSESGLVGYWNFEEGSGNTVLDQTLNGNNGTINGATYDANTPTQSCNLTNANGCDSNFKIFGKPTTRPY